jgi:hypothetical protein
LNIPLGNGEQLYAAVIGVPVNAKGEKEPPAPVGEPYYYIAYIAV